ncbi:MAG: AbrB/MazE/SpoVT family DNA-binding domain-containing protein [Euryarchaeota archaeon]|nr:AbrB/MazE/SpoVT family DNA-binding domain-containing protein [Euryarchaeota archaeon]
MIRIPAELASHMHLKPGTEVYVHPEGEDRIVVDVEA